MNNLISIIIPTYNRAHVLPEAIQSVLNQETENWELIIVDDGSTDNTKDTIQNFLSDNRITYHFQKNSWVSSARNKGVELSRGDYIIFLDSDDKFLPGLISSLNEECFIDYDLICWLVLKIIDGKSSIWKPEKLEKLYNNITATFLAGSICYKKEIFLKAGGFDPEISFGENYELGVRIGNIPALKVKIINKPFLIYSIESDKRSSSTVLNKISSNLKLLSKHEDLYRNDNLSHSRLQYQLGYLYEKAGESQNALNYYQKAWKIRPWYYKAFLKMSILSSINFFKTLLHN